MIFGVVMLAHQDGDHEFAWREQTEAVGVQKSRLSTQVFAGPGVFYAVLSGAFITAGIQSAFTLKHSLWTEPPSGKCIMRRLIRS